MRIKLSTFSFLCLFLPVTVIGAGNETIESYAEAKKLFDTVHHDHRTTIYCGFPYTEDRSIELPEGFIIASFPSRARRMEREHVVPAENFGRAFVEWREGAQVCVRRSGETYKGRECAAKASPRFRRMYCDLHNLFPSVGCVNAARRNYEMEALPYAVTPFGPTCPMKFRGRHVEPPDRAKGVVARVYRYMDWAYREKIIEIRFALVGILDKT